MNEEFPAKQEEGVEEKRLRMELLRLAAEFDNYKKEVAKEREFWRERAFDEALLLFLPVYEALERALGTDQDLEQLRSGLQAVYNLFGEILNRLGCTPIPAVGTDFDPLYHEAVLAEASDQPKNKVLAELEKGWVRQGRVLRPAKVKVSLGPKGGEPG
ncbi:MAG: nucleotide exchange factor GrpE [Candidatus Bipolaricaulota bacterium]|nr:nucleotide exchange factor GrpE [Candidatus Bipolaricaulota bacterium]MDW8127400.1 nucleotide exchange factor GrpE [Candidatus Bipolaricaulota bacterium]